MTESQKAKTKFRSSAKWLKFRHFMNVKQKGLDPITNKKLLKGANLHHCDLNEKHYQDLSDPEKFVFLNRQTHDTLHWLFRYYEKDPGILDRLKFYLDKMVELKNV